MSLGFEIELPMVRVKAALPGRSTPTLLTYSGLKGLPLFRARNGSITGVVESNGAGGVTLLELVTTVDEDPYRRTATGWEAQLECIAAIVRGLGGLRRKGPSRLPTALDEINRGLRDAWTLVESSKLARLGHLERVAGQSIAEPSKDGPPLPRAKPLDIVNSFEGSLSLDVLGSAADTQINFSANLRELGRRGFAQLVSGTSDVTAEDHAQRMVNRFLRAYEDWDRFDDLRGFLYLVFHRLAAELIVKEPAISKNRFAVLPRFNLRRARSHLTAESREALRSALSDPAKETSRYESILEIIAGTGHNRDGELTMRSSFSRYPDSVHKSTNTCGAFLHAVLADKVYLGGSNFPARDFSAGDDQRIDPHIIDVEDTLHCPEYRKGWPNLVFELRTPPPDTCRSDDRGKGKEKDKDKDKDKDKEARKASTEGNLVTHLSSAAELVMEWDIPPHYRPVLHLRSSVTARRCGACQTHHGAIPSGPFGHWHSCTACGLKYCGTCGSLLRGAPQQSFGLRTVRSCDECLAPTALV